MQEQQHMADAPPYLRIEQLKKQFGAFSALKDISLDIFRGEFVCFLGPSGCTVMDAERIVEFLYG